MHENLMSYRGSFQQLADARRVLKMAGTLDKLPCLPAEDRQELHRIRSLALRCVGAAVAELVDVLDTLHGDTDLEDDDPEEAAGDEEDGNDAEDEQLTRAALCRADGPGCLVGDPDRGVDDDPHDWNELEVDEADRCPQGHCGVDQTRPIGPDNPEAV